MSVRRRALRREKPINRTRKRGPRQTKPKGERRRPLRATPEQWEALRQQAYRRADGQCERCGTHLAALRFWECHHRKLKSQGGADVIENLVALCPTCHNGNPESVHMTANASRDTGFIVASWGDPATWPLLLHDGRRVLLDARGRYVEIEDEVAA